MISTSQHKILIGKEEYLPYSAEIHYFRVSKRYWSICFERIKRAGFRIISTVVPWNLHEDGNREFDFSGQSDQTKDLIVFVELAREFGFKLILRPGPYIASEWRRNGLPDFLDKYPEIFAKDSEGNFVRPPAEAGVAVANYPSLLNPTFLSFVKHYLNGLTEIIKNYVYPRGPVFMIELGSDNFFGGNFNPESSDYNPYVIRDLYPRFLEQKYTDIKEFNKTYGTRLKSFEDVGQIEDVKGLQNRNLASKMDWLRFKDHVQVTYLNTLKDLYLSFSCNPLFLSTVSFHGNVQPPMNDFTPQPGEAKVLGVRLTWGDSSSDLLQKARYLTANSSFAFATELSIGLPSADPVNSKNFFPVSDRATKYLLTLALAGGIKGFNANMFVERDHWYGAALANDGTIQPAYEILRHFNAVCMKVDFGAFESVSKVGLVSYKGHSLLNLISTKNNFEYLDTLLCSTLPGIGRDLDRLKIDYAIPELTNQVSLDMYSTLIVPVSEYMDPADQQTLVDKIKAGVSVILVGLVPKYDTNGNGCHILSSFLKLKSQAGFEVAEVKAGDEAFPTLLFGTLACTDSQARATAKAGKSPVAFKFNRFKGTVLFISFDLSTQYYHTKMTYFEGLMAECKVVPFIYTSDPDVRAILRTDRKRALLYLLFSRPQLPFKKTERHPLRVAIKVDLKGAGIKSAKVSMTELFSGERQLLSAKQLAEGIVIELKSLDSRVWLLAPSEKSAAVITESDS